MAVDIIGEGAHMDVTESRYEAGESGPGPHIHREHADSFWVLEGELQFDVGPGLEATRLGAGGFVLVPPGVVHTFHNPGPGEARFLNFHAPAKNFAAHLRGEDVDFDSHDPPPDGGRPATDVVLVGPGEGETVSMGPSGVTFVVSDPDHLSLTHTTVAAGFPGPVPHLHETFVDSFYVLEGALTVRRGDDSAEIGPGEYAYVEPGTVHTFANRGEVPARFLNVMAPGGFEQYLREVAALPGPPDPEQMARIASRYDFRPAG